MSMSVDKIEDACTKRTSLEKKITMYSEKITMHSLWKENNDCHKCFDCMPSNSSQNLWSLSKGTQP